MAAISKELREMSQQSWFPIMMRELGYEPIKHGRWIKITQEWADYAEYFCSCCGRKIKAPFTLNPAWAFPYCHCGAKMDAQEVEE